MRLIILTFCILALCSACEQPLDEPESVDPIYLDLKSLADNAGKAVEAKKKEIEAAIVDSESKEKTSAERKHAQRLRFQLEKTLTLLEQDTKFYEIHALSRKQYDRNAYPAIYNAKKDWPNKSEFEKYLAEKRLQGASRNWNDRVPKLRVAKKSPEGAEPVKAKKEGE